MLLWKPQHNLGFPSFCLFIFYKHWPLPVLPRWTCSLQKQWFFFPSNAHFSLQVHFSVIAFLNITVPACRLSLCTKDWLVCCPLETQLLKTLLFSSWGKRDKSPMVIKLFSEKQNGNFILSCSFSLSSISRNSFSFGKRNFARQQEFGCSAPSFLFGFIPRYLQPFILLYHNKDCL